MTATKLRKAGRKAKAIIRGTATVVVLLVIAFIAFPGGFFLVPLLLLVAAIAAPLLLIAWLIWRRLDRWSQS